MKKVVLSTILLASCAQKPQSIEPHQSEVTWKVAQGTEGFTVYADFLDGTRFKYSFHSREPESKEGFAWATITRPNESDKVYEFDVKSSVSPWRHSAHKFEYGPEETVCSPKHTTPMEHCVQDITDSMMHFYNRYSKKVPLTSLLENYAAGNPVAQCVQYVCD